MSKYDPLWRYLEQDGRDALTLSYDEIKSILGFEIDHAFLTYKKEAAGYGYTVGKIAMKERRVMFHRGAAAQCKG